jgi:hypothetical protein
MQDKSMVTYILRSLHFGKIGRRRMLCTKSGLCLHYVGILTKPRFIDLGKR